MVLRRVAAADAVGLMVNMACGIVGVQHEAIDLRHVEMKNAGFVVVDPDDRVIVARHESVLSGMGTHDPRGRGRGDLCARLAT